MTDGLLLGACWADGCHNPTYGSLFCWQPNCGGELPRSVAQELRMRERRAMTDGGETIPALGEVLEFPGEQRSDDRQWIVLFEEDYDNVVLDVEGNLGVLVDIEQAGEILRLASHVLASLSHRDAEPDEPIRDMIAALEEAIGGD